MDLFTELAHLDPIAAAALASSDDDRRGTAGEADHPVSPLGIDLGAGHATLLPATSRIAAEGPGGLEVDPNSAESARDDDADHDDHPPRRRAWTMALLASYASAMTIACGWLWWTGHRRPAPIVRAPAWAPGPAPGALPDPAGAADAGRRAAASAVVAPPEPIAEGRLLTLGEAKLIDALEILPLGVSIGPVELRRTRVDGRDERRHGGSGALRLHLRLRNASDDAIFAPLDEAFVRVPDRRLPETFIQDASGGRVYAYRLPVSSEWEIVGQTFHELRPGEAIETMVLSDTESASALDGPLTWRLRLRTAPETTAVVGVAFDADDVEPIR